MFLNVDDTQLFSDGAGPGPRTRDGVLAEVPALSPLHGGPGSDRSAVKAPLLPLAEHARMRKALR